MEQFSAFEEQFSAVEEQCVEDLQLDFTPLHDIVRIFSGFDKLLPTEKAFLMALEFIGYLIGKYRVVAQNGPDGEPLTQPTTELLQWLKSMWYQGKYDEINYGIWFTI